MIIKLIFILFWQEVFRLTEVTCHALVLDPKELESVPLSVMVGLYPVF